MAPNKIIEIIPATEKKVLIAEIEDLRFVEIPKVQDKYEFGKYVKIICNYIIEKYPENSDDQFKQNIQIFEATILKAWKNQPEFIPTEHTFGHDFLSFEKNFLNSLETCKYHSKKEKALPLFKLIFANLNEVYGTRHEKLFRKSSKIIYIRKDENNKSYLEKDGKRVELSAYDSEKFEEFYKEISVYDKNSDDKIKKFFCGKNETTYFNILVSDKWTDSKGNSDWYKSIIRIDDDLYVDFKKNSEMYELLQKTSENPKTEIDRFEEIINALNFYYQNPEFLCKFAKNFITEEFEMLGFKKQNNKKDLSNTIILANASEFKKIKDEIKKDETETFVFFTKERIEEFPIDKYVKSKTIFCSHVKIYPGTGPLKEYMEKMHIEK